MIDSVIFYLFATITVIAGVLAITQRNPVTSVLALVLAFISTAIIWLMLEAEFLSLVLVLVYVGAVMTLFLFVIMMLNIDVEQQRKRHLIYSILALGILAIFLSMLWHVIPKALWSTQTMQLTNETSWDTATPILSNTDRIGMVLYTHYVLAFEIAAIILLVAIVAAITLVHRKPMRRKEQNITQQILTKKRDRLSFADFQTESKS